MKTQKLFYYRISVVLIGMILFVGMQKATGAAGPKFKPAECSKVAPFSTKKLPVPKQIKGAKCGYLVVPENRHKPNGPQIKLAVIVIPAKNSPRAPDPIVHLAGGPGGSSWIEIDSLMKAGLNRHRDLVLMSQRGTMFAKPELMCSEMEAQVLDGLSLPLDSAAYKKQLLDATNKCAARLRQAGIDLDAYNTTENAADFADLRKALGISEWNVFGVSYGSYLAQALMFQHPEGIRTVTLDSVLPLSNANMVSTTAQHAHEAFKNIFAACIAQAACHARYPNLEQTVTNLVNQLAENPVTTSVQVESNSKPLKVVIDGGSLIKGMINTSFGGELVKLPAWIDELAHGRPKKIGLARAIPAIIPTNVAALGMGNSMMCSSFITSDSATDVLNSGRKYFPDFPDSVLEPALHFGYLLDTCKVWDVKKKPMNLHPNTSKIPTLLLSGTFDPVTPPSTAVTVSKSLPNAIVQSVPGIGHGVVQSSKCAQKIMSSFLSNPGIPDTSCAAEPPPAFNTGG